MDRPRRFLLLTVFFSTVATVVISAVWFGYRIGESLLAPPSSSPTIMWASSCSAPDESPPALLPDSEVVRCANRLKPCGEPDLASEDMPRLEPPVATHNEPCDSEETVGPLFERPTTTGPDIAQDANVTPDPVVLNQIDVASEKVETPAQPPKPDLLPSGPASTPWATAYRPGSRSPQLEQAARQADQHTRHGFDLASRKAYFSARAEFVQALRIVSQGLDSEHNSQVHGQALSAGLTALDEVDDFVPVGSNLEGNLDLDDIIKGHKTTVLKLADSRRLTPLQCVRQYVDYARGQLAVAAGGEVAGSMALHALGKLHWSLAERQHASRPIDDTKALVLLQAASEVCSQNYLALNDMGVLLARGGRYDSARDVLEKGVAISQDPTVRINLASVYRYQGNLQRAEQREKEAATLLAARGRSQGDPNRPVPPVKWVAPQKFAKSYASVAEPLKPAPARRDSQPQAKPPVIESPKAKQASRGFSWDWFLKASNKTLSR